MQLVIFFGTENKYIFGTSHVNCAFFFLVNMAKVLKTGVINCGYCQN